MKYGLRNKLCLIVVAFCVSCSTSWSVANAQDNFREFDRKMVATPAELFEALSSFQPPRQHQEIDAQRQKEIEAAGREFLSKLSPAQQEKAWEFAEKYLRKNGVDSASSKKLMKDFGLPPEMQSELAKQFRKYSNRSSNSDTLTDRNPDDAISQILQKARDKFDRDSQNPDKTAERVEPLKLDQPESDSDADDDQGDVQENQPESERNPNADDSKLKERNADQSNQRGQDRDSDRDVSDPPKEKAENDRTASQTEPANALDPFNPGSKDRAKANPDSPFRLPEQRTDSNQEKKGDEPDVDLDQLLKRFGNLKKNIEGNREAGSSSSGQGPFSAGNLDWEKVIKDLAEEGSVEKNFKPTQGMSNPIDGSAANERESANQRQGLDQSMLERAKELISGSFDPEKNSDQAGLEGSSTSNGTADEKVEARFDRLLVKAAERAAKSGGKEEGVSKSVGSLFGSLIERVQKQASNNDGDRERTGGQSSAGSESGGNRNDRASNKDNVASNSSAERNSKNDRSNPNANSARESSLVPPTSDSTVTSLDPRKMLDSITNLSAINPTQVFTFFAVVGLVLFVGYLLAQSFIGDEVKMKQRKVIQQIRNTKIKTPKDLVETVDTFLLGKFGIKSSWWNARLAQRVLNSGSPEFQARVDDLIQDYVRARYMRDDIQIPDADQQRYKKMLEELSALEIKPASDLGFVPKSSVSFSPAPVEG